MGDRSDGARRQWEQPESNTSLSFSRVIPQLRVPFLNPILTPIARHDAPDSAYQSARGA